MPTIMYMKSQLICSDFIYVAKGMENQCAWFYFKDRQTDINKRMNTTDINNIIFPYNLDK